MTSQKLIVTTLGELIEGLHGRLIARDRLPAVATLLDLIISQSFDDLRADGSRKYSADARVSYLEPEHPFTVEHEDYIFIWLEAFWAWREMLTPHDFETLNSERVVMSEVLP